MKYYTFKLNWTDPTEGTDPSTVINNETTRFEPSFTIGEGLNAIHYAYLVTGDIDSTALTAWEVTEVTSSDMLVAAQSLIPEAFMTEGKVFFPVGDFTVGV